MQLWNDYLGGLLVIYLIILMGSLSKLESLKSIQACCWQIRRQFSNNRLEGQTS